MAVPVTLITGYLGSGKTTLLRRIVAESGKRIAILMNEFGDIAIDDRVIEGKDIRMTELSGGCVCCSLSGEFEAAVKEILETVAPEWIVVETTGVAEPGALAHDIMESIEGVRLDAIVTLVDCDSLVRFPSLGHTGREQIEMADLLVLNKTDLVQQETLGELRDALARMNPRAAVAETVRAEVGMDMLFGIGRRELPPAHKTHRIAFSYFDFTTEGTMDHAKTMAALESLPREVFRSKGFLVTEKGTFLMNYVAGRLSVEPFQCVKTEIVFIGKGVGKRKEKVLSAMGECII